MTTSSFAPSRSRRIAAAFSVLAVAAVTAGVLMLAVSVGLPDSWWPQTGQAFAADAHAHVGQAGHHDPCAAIVGRAKAYCERGNATPEPGNHHAGAAWRLVPAGAGVAALVLWRSSRRTAGQKRG
ncbi:hypothetical protein BIV25_37350 [Streptomyces sp. MUSC 14]|uniref:hypothetical protein n=1 Tax=Streptomyces sp. MUSC 14 TaxID=1354889 RepID=UPI0008F5B05B|nr:hypothetical protein [Streptomyces sp. MUSC 14]OIJ88170.1 hypothetical protein BIV25_37350 [Streptomyces sp. MUSC 14]